MFMHEHENSGGKTFRAPWSPLWDGELKIIPPPSLPGCALAWCLYSSSLWVNGCCLVYFRVSPTALGLFCGFICYNGMAAWWESGWVIKYVCKCKIIVLVLAVGRSVGRVRFNLTFSLFVDQVSKCLLWAPSFLLFPSIWSCHSFHIRLMLKKSLWPPRRS